MRQDKLHPAERGFLLARHFSSHPSTLSVLLRRDSAAFIPVVGASAERFCAKRRAAFGKQPLITAEPYTLREREGGSRFVARQIGQKAASIDCLLLSCPPPPRLLLACAWNIWSIFLRNLCTGSARKRLFNSSRAWRAGKFFRLIARFTMRFRSIGLPVDNREPRERPVVPRLLN